MNVVIVLLLISLASTVVVSQRATLTITTTALVTTTSTATKSTSTACVTYTNAPSACRRKKQLWINSPIIAKDDVDQSHLIQPQPVQWVQPTADPDVHHADRYKIPYSRYAQPSNGYFYPVDTQWALQPSVADPGYFEHFYPYGRVPDQAQPSFRVKDPLKIAQIYDLFGRLLSIAALVTQTATATITNVVTTTVTTTTNTVVISGCKPPGITYNPC